MMKRTAGLQKDIRYWVNIANYDLKTAEAMLEADRYLYVLFTCQQAIEKMLKAAVVAKTKKFPPRIHNLIKLTEICGIVISEEDKLFLEKLSYYYLETRYPEEIIRIGKTVDRKLSKKYFEKTKELIRWLKQKKMAE